MPPRVVQFLNRLPPCVYVCVCVWVAAGSTGAPKGVVHSTAGYLLYAAMTHKYVFDYREGDVYACVADIGYVARSCQNLL